MRRGTSVALAFLFGCSAEKGERLTDARPSDATTDTAPMPVDATQFDAASADSQVALDPGQLGGSDASDDAAVVVVDGIPRFSTALHVDLARVEEVTRFRSGIGHDFSDASEMCRSMKHYFCFNGCESGRHSPSWTTIELRSPVTGVVQRIDDEREFGSQVHLQPDGFASWTVRIFHVTPVEGLTAGMRVAAGQRLGTHATDDTLGDVSVENFEGDYRLVSFFETLTDEAFAPFLSRGVSARSDLIISREERDADSLGCVGDSFRSEGTLSNWVVLE